MNDDNLLCFEGIKLRGLLLKPSIPCQPPHQEPTLSLPSEREAWFLWSTVMPPSPPPALADRKPNPLSALPLPLSILLSFGERLLDIFLPRSTNIRTTRVGRKSHKDTRRLDGMGVREMKGSVWFQRQVEKVTAYEYTDVLRLHLPYVSAMVQWTLTQQIPYTDR